MLQRYCSHDLDLLGSRNIIDHMTVGLTMYGFLYIGGPLKIETITLSRMVLRYYVLAKHIPIENALIQIFEFRDKILGYSILQLLHIAAP